MSHVKQALHPASTATAQLLVGQRLPDKMVIPRIIAIVAALLLSAPVRTAKGAIQLSSPQLLQGTLADGRGACIHFTSDQAGYAVVYVLAHNVAGYNPGELVQTIRGNITVGLNEFRWNGVNAAMRNPNLLAGGNGLSNVGVGAVNMIADGSEVVLRVVAMNQAVWNADWIAGNFGSAPTIRLQGLDLVNGTVYACDVGNATGAPSNKVIRKFDASTGTGLDVLPYGLYVGNGTTYEPWDVFADPDGAYVVSSPYAPYGNSSVGCLYQFASNGAHVGNLISNLGLTRGGDRLGTGSNSIFYLSLFANQVLRVTYSGSSESVLTNATPTPGALVWNSAVAVAAVDNGAEVAPVLYVALQNNNIGVTRYDWTDSGYQRNAVFARNFWTDQQGFHWRLLNVVGGAATMNVLGTIGTVVDANSVGPWGARYLGLTLANKGDVHSDLFIRAPRAIWRLRCDGTSAWPGYLEPCTNDSGADLAFDGQSLYFACGNTGVLFAGRFLVRDAFPDTGTAQSQPITWNANLLSVGVSHIRLE